MRTRLSPSVSSRRADDGLSLVEVIVAVTLFALVAAATGAMLLTGIGVSRDTRSRTAASLAASQVLEDARKLATSNFMTLASAPATPQDVVVNQQHFSVSQTVAFIPKNAPSGSCSSTGQGGNSAVEPVLLVTESVTWSRMDSTRPVTVSTTLTPPVGAYPQGTGGVDVTVVDRDGAPVPGVPVTISGSTTTPLTTGSTGCAYAAFLAPGNYTVTASLSGYVDNQERATASQATGVINGQTSSLTFYYDRAATIQATLSAAVAPAAGLPISIGNSGLAGTGSVSFPAGTTTLSPVYPYSRYGIWAGRCPEAYPAAVDGGNNPLYSPASVIAVTPVRGQTVASTVPLYPLTVQVQQNGNNGNGNGNGKAGPVNGATVTATETAGTAKTACGGPFSTYTLRPSANVGGTDGVSITGLPLGTFVITARSGAQVATGTVVVRPSGANLTLTL